MGKGETNEPLLSVPRTPAGADSEDVLAMQGLEHYYVAVFGLASDGTPEPTATPSATPEPVVVVPIGTVEPVYTPGVEQWRGLVASIFPEWAVDKVLAVMWCESKGDPNATGSQGEMGLMQLHPRWHRDATYEPYGNLVATYRISSGGTDWSQWTCG